MGAEERCDMWWKSFVCLLPKGHEGPHEDWGAWRNLPGKGGGKDIGVTKFHISWGEDVMPEPSEMVRVV